MVCNGGPWSFDNSMLIISRIPAGEEPLKVPLWFIDIWIQIHDLPTGFMSEVVGKQLGDFFGEFLMYDAKNNSSIWMEYMRLKIRLDVRKPLKRKKKIKRKNGTKFTVSCKYERLGEFCFICGLLSHTERFCRRNLDKRSEMGTKEWGLWLRAPPRRAANQGRSKWLRNENDTDWEAKNGRHSNCPPFTGENVGDKGKGVAGMHESRVITKNLNFGDISEGPGGNNINRILQIRDTAYGLEEEEADGLGLEDRKRRRSGIDTRIVMDTDDTLVQVGLNNDGNKQKEAEFSGTDYSASSQNDLAKLAVQASQAL